jgi:hypothetical protein
MAEINGTMTYGQRCRPLCVERCSVLSTLKKSAPRFGAPSTVSARLPEEDSGRARHSVRAVRPVANPRRARSDAPYLRRVQGHQARHCFLEGSFSEPCKRSGVSAERRKHPIRKWRRSSEAPLRRFMAPMRIQILEVKAPNESERRHSCRHWPFESFEADKNVRAPICQERRTGILPAPASAPARAVCRCRKPQPSPMAVRNGAFLPMRIEASN